MFKEVEHTADLALQIEAEKIEELFAEAARGMFYLIYGNVKENNVKKFEIQLDSFSLENLLVDFLNELLYISEKDDFALKDLNIEIENNNTKSLISILYLIKNTDKKTAIKAATYHNLEIEKKGNYYQTQIIFDI